MIPNTLSEEDRARVVLHIGKEVADAQSVMPLVQAMHKESLYSDLPFDQPQYERICSFIRDNPGFNGGLYVEYDGVPVAFAYFVYRPFMGSRKSWMTVMHTVYLRADIRATPVGAYIWRRILMAVRGWSVPRGAKGLMFNVTSGIAVEETDLALRGAGATYLGGNYLLRI